MMDHQSVWFHVKGFATTHALRCVHLVSPTLQLLAADVQSVPQAALQHCVWRLKRTCAVHLCVCAHQNQHAPSPHVVGEAAHSQGAACCATHPLSALSALASTLTSLQLCHCNDITDEALAWLGKPPIMCRLASLRLTDCRRITNRGLSHLHALVALTTLSLSGCSRITDAGLLCLASVAASLVSLDVSHCAITDTGLGHMQGLRKLTSLGLSWCSAITSNGVARLSAGAPALISLRLAWCYRVDDRGLSHLAALCALQQLDLTGVTSITDLGLQYLGTSLSGLESLKLCSCRWITEAGLKSLITAAASLTALHLHGCSHVDDAALAHISLLGALTSLDLSECPRITDVGLMYLKQLSQLVMLDLRMCSFVSTVGIAHLKALPGLRCYSPTGVLGWIDDLVPGSFDF